jgi:hypothetical protein
MSLSGGDPWECRLTVPMEQRHGKASSETVDQAIARIATNSHGVVTRSELARLGVTPEQIRTRLRKGSLIRVFRGVYRVGHKAPSRESRYMAAVKACGDRAVLCGRCAAHLWGLIKGPPPRPEVRAPTKRLVRGVTTHRHAGFGPGEVTDWHGIPVTAVPRTLVDLASSLREPALARACHEAGVLYRTTPRQVDAVLSRLSNACGRAKLQRVLHGDVPVTLSRLESRFLKLLREAGLPLPITNRVSGGHRVDCRWPKHRLTVELDSYLHHNSRHSWDKDRLREREARLREDEFRRFAWRDVFEDPGFMLDELGRLLSS